MPRWRAEASGVREAQLGREPRLQARHHGGGVGRVPCRRVLDEPGEAGGVRAAEEVRHPDTHTEFGVHAGDQAHDQQRMAAQGEEVVVDADPFHAQDLREQGAQRLLVRGTRGPVRAGSGAEVRGGQSGTVELAVGGQREPVQGHEGRRDHEVGQLAGHERAQSPGLDAFPCRVGNQAPPGGHVPGDDGCLDHVGMGGQRGFDFAGFDAEAADLELGVGAACVLQVSVAVPAGEVAGAVHARAGRAVRVGHEALGGQPRARVIAAGDRPRDVQLADDTRGNGTQPGAEDVGAHVGQRAAEGVLPVPVPSAVNVVA
ncbi:hypothetical protein Q3Y56_00575 [Streptomyces sp. XD-27]|nr:hypothetical protein [Streptomyces sp. XD-27]WKX68642.1 hypothetical protein Q3Y56_00575 [Streptomyces sp. XD-27]